MFNDNATISCGVCRISFKASNKFCNKTVDGRLIFFLGLDGMSVASRECHRVPLDFFILQIDLSNRAELKHYVDWILINLLLCPSSGDMFDVCMTFYTSHFYRNVGSAQELVIKVISCTHWTQWKISKASTQTRASRKNNESHFGFLKRPNSPANSREERRWRWCMKLNIRLSSLNIVSKSEF